MARISIIVMLFLLASSCKKDSTSIPVVEVAVGELELLNVYDIDVPEPSGLSFGPDKLSLLTVSDHTNMVYEMDMQGNILRTLNYEGKDLEGVSYNPDENIVAVVEEADRELSLIDYNSGDLIQTYKINIPSNSSNSGLEGISYNPNNKLYYVLNEVNPELLILWDANSGIISEDKLDFATDYSGIYVEAEKSHLWIVSDQSKKLYQCDYNANVLKTFELDILKYEGVVVEGKTVFLINDATAKLYHYQIKN